MSDEEGAQKVDKGKGNVDEPLKNMKLPIPLAYFWEVRPGGLASPTFSSSQADEVFIHCCKSSKGQGVCKEVAKEVEQTYETVKKAPVVRTLENQEYF